MTRQRRRCDYSEVDKMLGSCSDSEISKKTGIDRRYIWRRRRIVGAPVIAKWDKYTGLLGTMRDSALGEMIGISENAVTRKRIRSFVPPFAGSKERQLQIEFAKTLSGATQYLATPAGCADIVDSTTIYELKFILTTTGMHRAIGQLLSYSYFIKNKKLCIVTTRIAGKSCQEVCDDLGISIRVV